MLVILGLLTGGILAGQSLIRAAELRSVSTDIQRYSTAMYSFRDKYFALPGDMTNATAFWGKDNTNCSGNTGTAMTPGTCNGNGDGFVNGANTAGATGEYFQYWKQLALAGMIEGNYTGLTNTGGTVDAVPGVNVPRSRISNAGYSIGSYDGTSFTTDLYSYAINYGNHYMFGTQNNMNGMSNSALKPEGMWNIDTKIDDGKPGSGKMIAIGNTLANCTTSASATNFSASYNLSNAAVVCAVRYILN